jgi:hypothetical protein
VKIKILSIFCAAGEICACRGIVLTPFQKEKDSFDTPSIPVLAVKFDYGHFQAN